MNPHKLIAESWKVFEEKVIPKHAEEAQRLDMYMAFFAGATTVTEALDMAIKKSPILGVEVMNSLKKETDTFVADMGKDTKTDPQKFKNPLWGAGEA